MWLLQKGGVIYGSNNDNPQVYETLQHGLKMLAIFLLIILCGDWNLPQDNI